MKDKPPLSVFENRVMGGIFGSKRKEVTQWKFHTLYSSSDNIKVIKLRRRGRWRVTHTWKIRSVSRILTGKLGGKQSCSGPRRRWEKNIKKNHEDDVNWILVNREMKIPAHYFSAMVVLHGVSYALSKTSFRARHILRSQLTKSSPVCSTRSLIWTFWFPPYCHVIACGYRRGLDW
jgi:hypothetical protein